MKKIFSLVLVVSMLFAMMISASAAYSMGFSTTTPVVTVGDTFDVVLNIDLSDGQQTSGGSIVLNYDPAYATLEDITEGTMTAGASNWVDLGSAKANKTFTTALSESGTFCVATFKAIAATDEFVVSAKTVSFTFRNPTKRESTASNVASATIKINAPGPSIVYGAAAECAKEWTTKKDAESAYTHTFQNVAVAEAKFDAAANASEAGFAFAKDAIDATYGENKKAFDATAIAGDGSVEYTMVMYGVPYGNGVNAIFAKPYYVPAN